MSSTFFTTNDGDIILRAGPDPDSKHDFRIHKFILSLASSVFEDMFAFPQPSDQTQSEEHQLPIIDVPDPPAVLDMILRLIYPGVEPPKITDLPALSAVLSAADKYNITSIYPTLRDTLKGFLPDSSFGVYVIACRFGFREEMKEAAKVGSTYCIEYAGFDEEARRISSTDLLRWVRFVQQREHAGRRMTEATFDWWNQHDCAECKHGEEGRDYYFRLEKAVADAFAVNPCIGKNDLFDVLDAVPDPPPGCPPSPNSQSAEFYRGGGSEEAFNCPLQPMSIRNNLLSIAEELESFNCMMLERVFGKVGSS